MRYLVTMKIDIEELQNRKTTRVSEKPLEEPKPEVALTPFSEPIRPIVYGVKDAGKILGISRSSIYTLLNAGLLTPVRFGRRLLFTEYELRSLVEKNRAR